MAETPGSHEQLINSGGVYSSLWAGESPFAAPPSFIQLIPPIDTGVSTGDDAAGVGVARRPCVLVREGDDIRVVCRVGLYTYLEAMSESPPFFFLLSPPPAVWRSKDPNPKPIAQDGQKNVGRFFGRYPEKQIGEKKKRKKKKEIALKYLPPWPNSTCRAVESFPSISHDMFG